MSNKSVVFNSRKLIDELILQIRIHQKLQEQALSVAVQIEAIENKISCDADLVQILKAGGVHDWLNHILLIEDGKFKLIKNTQPNSDSICISTLDL